MAIKSYIRGFQRNPINTEDYITQTNQFLLSAEAVITADGGTLFSIDWKPYNEVIYLVVFYTV